LDANSAWCLTSNIIANTPEIATINAITFKGVTRYFPVSSLTRLNLAFKKGRFE
jgi:hypothetical protein